MTTLVRLILLLSLGLNQVSYGRCNDLEEEGAEKYPALAKRAGLIYRKNLGPGWKRRRSGNGFAYFDTNGSRITENGRLEYIKGIGIPPAWTNVWISPNPRSHVLARGYDDAKRKQSRYHPEWTRVTAEVKFERVIDFGRQLHSVRKSVQSDLETSANGLSKNRVIAGILRLMDLRPIRVGSQSSAVDFEHYGATTLRKKHLVHLGTSKIQLLFDGKHGVEHDILVVDPVLAKLLRELVDVPGYEIFRYRNDKGEMIQITERDVNAYLKEKVGDEFSVKDIRTWAATVKAAQLLKEIGKGADIDARLANLDAIFEKVGAHLINEPEESRESYVHPGLVDAYEAGELLDNLSPGLPPNYGWYSPSERLVLRYFTP